MWISHCGKPVSVCDGSDSDCWLMECGYITCVGECVHGGCNPPPLSLVSLWLRAQAPRIPTPDTSFLVGCANETEPIVPAYHETLLFSSLTSAFIYDLGSKVALFIAHHAWG